MVGGTIIMEPHIMGELTMGAMEVVKFVTNTFFPKMNIPKCQHLLPLLGRRGGHHGVARHQALAKALKVALTHTISRVQKLKKENISWSTYIFCFLLNSEWLLPAKRKIERKGGGQSEEEEKSRLKPNRKSRFNPQGRKRGGERAGRDGAHAHEDPPPADSRALRFFLTIIKKANK